MRIQAIDIHKAFVTPTGKPLSVLNGCQLDVRDQEHVVIVGPSGVGKSTLLHILGLLDQPSSGQVVWNEEPVDFRHRERLAKKRNQQIGFVFQHHYLLGECTVLENVLIPGLILGGSQRHLKSRAHQLLEQVGLADREMFFPRQLSGGERQRVALCRALINEPEVILADEVTGNLDPSLKAEMMRLLLDSCRSFGATLIAVTHDFSLLQYYDTVYTLKAGQLLLETPS